MKKSKWLLCTLAALLLAGCSLAQPEKEGKRMDDRLAGFYMVYTWDGLDGFYDNPYLEEYGSVSLDTGYGNVNISDKVLFAVEEKPRQYVFPGMKRGYSLLLVEDIIGFIGSEPVMTYYSDMAPGETGNGTHVSDEETSYSISGTIYFPKGEDGHKFNGLWKCYLVYQTEDGRLYLNGSGNTYSVGGSFGHSTNQTRTITGWDGKTVTESIDISVWVEEVDPLERLVVTQFDADNAIVRSDDLVLREDLPEVDCEAETAWVLVEEITTGGTVRTAYNVPEEGEFLVSHMVVLTDEEGLGIMTNLTIR